MHNTKGLWTFYKQYFILLEISIWQRWCLVAEIQTEKSSLGMRLNMVTFSLLLMDKGIDLWLVSGQGHLVSYSQTAFFFILCWDSRPNIKEKQSGYGRLSITYILINKFKMLCITYSYSIVERCYSDISWENISVTRYYIVDLI